MHGGQRSLYFFPLQKKSPTIIIIFSRSAKGYRKKYEKAAAAAATLASGDSGEKKPSSIEVYHCILWQSLISSSIVGSRSYPQTRRPWPNRPCSVIHFKHSWFHSARPSLLRIFLSAVMRSLSYSWSSTLYRGSECPGEFFLYFNYNENKILSWRHFLCR